ncbi:MAG: hypothetical protein HZA61_08705 [Candidatus Eisenbacteria bacterium]|uniref:Uncharacterized protein n=1 Tax=Eiseniibacteriota bacterium TaxID=2212470 RepID=A0A933SFS0_UNCEI|nr:hypothetical protein [Candidatus Eisenbacteria bacterium]
MTPSLSGMALAALLASGAADSIGTRAAGEPAESPRAASHDVLAWPFFVKWDGDDGRSLRMIGPVTGRFRSPRTRADYLAFPFTGAFEQSDGRRERWLLWPFTGAIRDPRRNLTEVSLATPLVGFTRRRDGRVTIERWSPVWTDRRFENGTHAWQLTPLAYRRTEPGRGFSTTELGVLPGMGGGGFAAFRTWSAPDAGGWNAALVYGQHHDPRGGWTSLPPYVSTSWRDPVRGDSRFDALLPVFARWQRPERDLAIALPGWWRYRTARLRSTGAWPFYASFREVRDDSTRHEGGSIVWPFVSWGRGERYSAFGVLPLYYRLEDERTRFTTVPPLYFALRRPGLDARMITPLHVRWRGARDTVEWVGPWYRHAGVDRRTVGVFPLYDERHAPGMHERWVFPSWYSRRDSLGERRMLVPFWGRITESRTGNVTRFHGPLVTLHGPRAHGHGIVPLWYSGVDSAGRTTWVGPWFQRDAANGHRTRALLPIAWYENGAGRSELHLLPLSGYLRRPDGYRRTYVLWPVYSKTRQGDGSTRTRVLHLLGRDERSGERHRNWLQPLWYFDRTDARTSYFALLGGLLASRERTSEHVKWRVLLVPVRTTRAVK